MAIPVITSPALSDYAITTEEYTVATCNVSNIPTQVLCTITDGRLSSSYIMYQYSGTTYRKEIFGHEMGMVSGATIRFIAVNADGGDTEVAPSTITVSRPTYTEVEISDLIDRLVYLCKHPDEYGGNNVLTSYNVVRELSQELFDKDSIKMPIIWIHSVNHTTEPRSMDEDIDIIKLNVQFTVVNIVADNTKTKIYEQTDSAIRYMLRANPNMQISGNSFMICNSKHINTKFPDYKSYGYNNMDIDVQFIIDTRS